MDDELRGLLARYARGELSADDARRAILRYPKWRVAEIDGELETVALDDGTPMLIAESSASDGPWAHARAAAEVLIDQATARPV